MFIVDRILEDRETEGKPVRVALVGAGYMGRGITRNFLAGIKGMRLCVIANRSVAKAEAIYTEAGVEDVARVTSAKQLEQRVASGLYSVTDDASLACAAGNIDVVIEATGTIEFGAKIALDAIGHGKHVVLMNAELDATVGPILKTYADSAGVVLTDTDGDEPGVAMNLLRIVKGWGLRPVVAGNFKGMLDHYRTPETQKGFAEKYNQSATMVTSFADGTKLSMETAILANAAGFTVAQRGMIGHKTDHVRNAIDLYPQDLWQKQGIVDFLLGAEPFTGAFVLGYGEDPVAAQYLDYFKMGPGPVYAFHTPYHLPHLQIAATVARAALFGDSTVAPVGAPSCEVITMAKRNLKRGELLDGIGGFMTYGMIDKAEAADAHKLLPMGVSEGCRLTCDVRQDEPLSYQMVGLPESRLVDRLRQEQAAL